MAAGEFSKTLKRLAWFEREGTNAHRVIHGASSDMPGLYVDRFGPALLAQSSKDLTDSWSSWLVRIAELSHQRRDVSPIRSVYFKKLELAVRGKSPEESSPKILMGRKDDLEWKVRENGLNYLIRFDAGYSVGFFPDMRENRKRIIDRIVGPGLRVQAHLSEGAEVLNTFSYTCAFSVALATTGARVTSLDLSQKYLNWGKENFELNGFDPKEHDFIYGDCFDWMKRLIKKGRKFDLLILDPPTFSKSKSFGAFKATRDYAKLTELAGQLLKSDGVMLAATNAAALAEKDFMKMVQSGLSKAKRRIVRTFSSPVQKDFRVSETEQPYLKAVWLRLD